MHLSSTIPQYQSPAPEWWNRFLYKASIGSYKAVDILEIAELAVAAELSGEGFVESASEEEHYQTLQDASPDWSKLDWPQIRDAVAEMGLVRHIPTRAQCYIVGVQWRAGSERCAQTRYG